MTALSWPQPSLLDDIDPLDLSRGVLRLTGTKVRVSGRHHVPANTPLLVVSNHRSPLDGPVLMVGLNRDVAFVCHQYMAHVPFLRDVVHQFGAFPLETPQKLFRQGCKRLRQSEAVGIFPEGAKSMVQLHPPQRLNPFHRGFAHLALRAPISSLALLPVAIASDEVGFESPIPLSLLAWFDPDEPLFQKGGGHPIVFYRDVEVRIGEPIWVTSEDREDYKGRQGMEYAQRLSDKCWNAVDTLLQE